MTSRVRGAHVVGVAAGATVLALLAGCSSGSDPVQAGASAMVSGLAAGSDVAAVSALTNASAAVLLWQVQEGRYPSATEFATIPDAALTGTVTVSYTPTPDGFCLTAMAPGPPAAVRVWRQPGGLQAPGSSC